MKTTVMPAYSLTGNCIWNSFHNSNKRHIIITGTRGSGKTTLLKKLFPNPLPGITSWAVPKEAVYLKDNSTGQSAKVGYYNASLEGCENKMSLIGDGFSELGIKSLMTALESESKWISIDEIGYLESTCDNYLNFISSVMDKKQVIAVVRKQNLSHLTKICERNDVFLIDLDAPFGNIGCVIMASGLGTRFGSNKLMSSFDGMPLISRILDSTSGIFQKRVVVTRYSDVKTLCDNANVDVILHSLPNQSDTIRLGLETMSNMTSCMFCTADQPLLKQDTISSLTLLAANNFDKILRPIFENTPGSPVIFPKWTYKELLQLPKESGGNHVIKQHPDSVQYLQIANSYELEDIDTIEDFIRLQEKARSFY